MVMRYVRLPGKNRRNQAGEQSRGCIKWRGLVDFDDDDIDGIGVNVGLIYHLLENSRP